MVYNIWEKTHWCFVSKVAKIISQKASQLSVSEDRWIHRHIFLILIITAASPKEGSFSHTTEREYVLQKVKGLFFASKLSLPDSKTWGLQIYCIWQTARKKYQINFKNYIPGYEVRINFFSIVPLPFRNNHAII